MQDISPIVSVITLAIGCGTLLIALSMLKGFITHGISVAIAEFFLRNRDLDQVEAMCRWFANGEEIMEYVKQVKEKACKCK